MRNIFYISPSSTSRRCLHCPSSSCPSTVNGIFCMQQGRADFLHTRGGHWLRCLVSQPAVTDHFCRLTHWTVLLVWWLTTVLRQWISEGRWGRISGTVFFFLKHENESSSRVILWYSWYRDTEAVPPAQSLFLVQIRKSSACQYKAHILEARPGRCCGCWTCWGCQT